MAFYGISFASFKLQRRDEAYAFIWSASCDARNITNWGWRHINFCAKMGQGVTDLILFGDI
jgi:hypothetical protein